MSIRVLLVDDSLDERALVARELERHFGQVEVLYAATAEQLGAALDDGGFDAAITDYRLRFTDGIAVLRALKRRHPERPVIMFTASGNEEVAVAAMKEGLDDYITKTARHYPRIGYALRACLEHAGQRRELAGALARESLTRTRLEVALDSAGMATWEHDLASDRLSCSEAMGPMFGRPAGYTHHSLAALVADIHPDDRAAVRQQVEAATQALAPFQLSYRTLGPDGVLRWLAVSGRPVAGSDGQPARLIGTARDISGEVRTRADLERQRAALEQADRQKNNFLAILAHELRNPLSAAGYSVDLLRRPDPGGATVARAAEVIGRQIGHMARLLDELLDLSRIAHNRIELDFRLLDLGRVVEQACEALRPALLANGHEALPVLPAGPVHVRADEMRLTQVLSNLLNNASKFTPRDGRIELTLAVQGDSAVLEVRDTGIGIDPARLDQVFEMFSQAEAKAHGGAPGLGIGLAVVRSLVRLHGGEVSAHSAGRDRGTAVRVRLPLAQAAPEAPAAPAPAAAPAPLSILLADDNRDAVDLLADILRLQGHVVRTAYDGLDAIAQAQADPPAVLILDIGMPGATGYEVARWVRTQAWGAAPLLIAVTGWGQEQDGDRAAGAGFDTRLVKPVDLGQLLDLIAQPRNLSEP